VPSRAVDESEFGTKILIYGNCLGTPTLSRFAVGASPASATAAN